MIAPAQQQDLLKASPISSPLVGKQGVQPQIALSLLTPAASHAIPQKPMRPLTAYHIFFQIERELIIQTSEGEIANKSSLDNKVYLDDVPQRYKSIKLLPDWYAGPGKRKKRKHRKQHGKIGFLELSRVISARWAELDVVDPETKAFVQKIAQMEIDEYYRDMKRYKEFTKDMLPVMSKFVPSKKSAGKRSSSNISNCNDSALEVKPEQPLCGGVMSPCPDMVASSLELMQLQIQLQTEIDHFLACIEKRKQELLSSHFAAKKTQLIMSQQVPRSFESEEPLQKKRKSFLCEGSVSEQNTEAHIVSARHSACLSPSSSDELEIGDDEIMNLWKYGSN